LGFSRTALAGKLRRMTLPRLAAAAAVLALSVVQPLHASGKKGEPSGISFHLQGEENDNPKMMIVLPTNGKNTPYRRLPEVVTKDIAAFAPFPSRDGDGFGVLLQLKPAVRNRWAAITASNVNRWVMAMVNGRAVDAVMIDKQITDGQMVIWKGIGEGEIAAFDEMVPRIGEEKPRGKQK
jgi:hypothetical protein